MPHAIAGAGRSVGLSGAWGLDVQVWGWSPAGHLWAVLRRVVKDEQPTVGWKLLEQGPKSQATSKTCSVGPSSRMDASDLDGHTLVSGHAPRQSALTLIAF